LIDLSRPPVRPGPRIVGWPIVAAVWGAGFAVLVATYSLLSNPGLSPVAALLIGLVGLVAAGAMGYAGMRLRSGASVWSNALQARGYPVGDPDSDRRVGDPEERDAWRRFRRGEIGRIDYELVMARRRFAHGELSTEEYHELVRELHAAREGPGRGPRSS
jgi:hypothetical protein